MFFSRKKQPIPKPEKWSLDQPLLNLSGPRGDPWTLADAYEGTLIMGATGSGKSSGSGRTLALAFLEAGFGGMVLTAKKDERQQWEWYCAEAGRSHDLMIFGPNNGYRYNFLDHELNRKGEGAGLTENLVNLFSTVLEVAERQSGSGGREDEGYWRRSNRQLSRSAIDLLIQAQGTISIPELYKIIVTAPRSPGEAKSEAWMQNSFCFQCLLKADQRPKSPRQRIDYEICADYFLLEFASLSDKTRSVIVSTFTSMIDVLNRGLLRELFCTETNFTPELVEDGKILLIDLAVKEYSEVGLLAQTLMKYSLQRSIERRNLAENRRPVFLWADEAQYFVTSYDMQFQTTARSSRVATVFLTQNLSNFYAALGVGDKGKAEADSLLANLNSKIFHANGDPITNEWASSLIGRTRQFFVNAGNNYDPGDRVMQMLGMHQRSSTSAGLSESYEFEVQPSEFTTLRKGGAVNQGHVDSILFQGGRRFESTGRTWLPVTFVQKKP